VLLVSVSVVEDTAGGFGAAQVVHSSVRRPGHDAVHVDHPAAITSLGGWRSVRACANLPVADEVGELVQDQPGIRDRPRIPKMTQKRIQFIANLRQRADASLAPLVALLSDS
jgi:hypothetical protein